MSSEKNRIEEIICELPEVIQEEVGTKARVLRICKIFEGPAKHNNIKEYLVGYGELMEGALLRPAQRHVNLTIALEKLLEEVKEQLEKYIEKMS